MIDEATKLEHALETLKSYIMVLRNEAYDLTGMGLWHIFCAQIQMANGSRVITGEQWDAFVNMQELLSERL